MVDLNSMIMSVARFAVVRGSSCACIIIILLYIIYTTWRVLYGFRFRFYMMCVVYKVLCIPLASATIYEGFQVDESGIRPTA